MTIVAKVNAIFGNVEDVLVVNEQLLAALSAVIVVDVGQKSGVCTGTHTRIRTHAHTRAHPAHACTHKDRHACAHVPRALAQ
jgi:hypothetical protein